MGGVSLLGAYHDRSFFHCAASVYIHSEKTEKDGKLPASYHDLATLCVSAGVYHAIWKTGTDYLWPASYQRESVRLAGYRDPSGDGNLSFTALFLLTLFDGIDGRLIMASRDLGADSLHTLRLVILPAVRRGMLSVLFTLFTMNLADFGTPVVIGGKYKVLATEAYLQAISSADLGKASAISVLLLLPAIAAFWLYGRALSSAGTFSGAGKMQTEWNGDYRRLRCLRIWRQDAVQRSLS